MNKELIITTEILVIIVAPLLVLYLRSNLAKKNIIVPCMVLPLVWYLTYALLHELSHVAGTYLVGGRVVDHKLIPKFWLGDFGTAWIRSEGFTSEWQQLVSTAFPYLLDTVFIVAGVVILKKNYIAQPFVIGLVFTLLILRSAFDYVSELTGFLSGDKGDYYFLYTHVGIIVFWLFVFSSITLSLFSVAIILQYDQLVNGKRYG